VSEFYRRGMKGYPPYVLMTPKQAVSQRSQIHRSLGRHDSESVLHSARMAGSALSQFKSFSPDLEVILQFAPNRLISSGLEWRVLQLTYWDLDETLRLLISGS
jgi:hypothetical protein